MVFEAGAATMALLKGAYSCIALVKGVGLLAFRDPHGIRCGRVRGWWRGGVGGRFVGVAGEAYVVAALRLLAFGGAVQREGRSRRRMDAPSLSPSPAGPLPSSPPARPLVLGKRQGRRGEEWCVASEDCAFGPIGFERVRDVQPGEMIIIDEQGRLVSRQVAKVRAQCRAQGAAEQRACRAVPRGTQHAAPLAPCVPPWLHTPAPARRLPRCPAVRAPDALHL